jgi:hypothetical protein
LADRKGNGHGTDCVETWNRIMAQAHDIRAKAD